MADDLLRINIEASRKSIAADGKPQLLYLLVHVLPPGIQDIKSVNLNLCLVLDRSTSMNGQRLENVISAATMIVEQLADDDVFSLVVFSDRSEVIWPASRVPDKRVLLRLIERINAFGGTEIFQGLEAGMEEIRRASLGRYTNHLILLTDGHTYGDNEACLDLIRVAANDSILFSGFGLGPDWNDSFLDQLAGLSGGETTYIETPHEVVHKLKACFQGLDAAYARKVRMLTHFPVGIKLVSAFRVSPSAQPLPIKGHELRLGSVEQRSPLSVLLEFEIEPNYPSQDLPVPMILTADIPSKKIRNYGVKEFYQLSIEDEATDQEPPDALVAAVRAWNFHQMNEKVWSDIDAGNISQAKTRMQRLTTRLTEAGHFRLAQQLREESLRLASQGSASAEGRKRLKFGTRSLVSETVRAPEL